MKDRSSPSPRSAECIIAALDAQPKRDGFIYYGSAFFTAAVNRIFGESNAPASCILRVRGGETEFDPDFFVAMEDLTGGQAGAALVGIGDNIYIRTFDEVESGLTITEQTSTGDIANAAAWRWWRGQPGLHIGRGTR